MKRLSTIKGLSDSWADIELGARSDGTMYNSDPFQVFFDSFYRTTRLAPDGSPLGETVSALTDGKNATPQDVIRLDDGNIVVLTQVGAGSYRPHVRVFDGDGNILTDSIQVPGIGSSDGGNQVLYSISAKADGGFVVIVGDDKSNFSERIKISNLEFGTRIRDTDTRAVEYTANGTLERDPYVVHQTTDPRSWTDANYSNGGDVLENGNIVVAYTEPGYGTLNNAKQLAESTGVGVSIIRDGVALKHFAVHTPVKTVLNDRFVYVDEALGELQRSLAPTAVALDNGGFVVFYTTRFFTNSPIEAFAQFHSADGTAGGLVALNNKGGFQQENGTTAYAALDGGRVAILTHAVTSLTGRDVYLTIVEEAGVTEGIKVASVSTVQNRTGYDGLDVGADGSIYVTLDDGTVHRFVQEDGLITADSDRLVDGSNRDDIAYGGRAGETFDMRKGDDIAYGGAGSDDMRGGGGRDQLEGDRGRDTVLGGGGADTLMGGDGRDAVKGQGGNDLAVGGAGNDRAWGGNGNDDVHGNGGNDRLWGDRGDDDLHGGGGGDTLIGGAGRDRLDGGSGDDSLRGGADADVFVFGEGSDRILDFVDNVDTLALSSDLLDGLTGGRQIVREFASKTADGILFDFGDDDLLIVGLTNRFALANDLTVL